MHIPRLFSVFAVWLAGATLFPAASAALMITSNNAGQVSQQVFEDGAFVLVEDGQPAFGIDRHGNCWFLDRGQLVTDPCAQMLDAMGQMREQAMAGLGPRERAMMESMMGGGSGGTVDVSRRGSRTIAGYPAVCHAVGTGREVCVSEKLLGEVSAEMGDARFIDMFKRFGQSVAGMGGDDPQARAVAALYEQGYPMRDMQQQAAIPGLNPAMLQFLPEAQRAQIMQQLGNGGAQMTGSEVVRVDRNAAMPALDLSRYPRTGFREYLQQTMGQMGAAPGMR